METVEWITACRDLPESTDLIHACERGEDNEFLNWALEICQISLGEGWEVASIILTGHKLFEQYQESRDGA